MVFSSLIFLFVFLPINLILYYASGKAIYRNIILIFFSLLFYAWGEPIWIVVLLFSSFFDFMNARLIENARSKVQKKGVLVLSITVNLGLLIAFKYSGFIYENINSLIELPFNKPVNNLPIGISFYTFQTISYVIDVYRGDVKAQRNPLKFLLFVSLFHQLVAGPIVRYKTIADEIDKRAFSWEDFSSGVSRFSFGLFKKVFIANGAGVFVDRYLIHEFATIGSFEAGFGLIMFAIQIYFDFSGYSDMAIGLGRMFGFHYDENFKHPYAANSITDFWRRWHISLGSFFRDYVYIPLGGNRKMQMRNLIVVWALTGLWHGASWNFLIWGLYFCFLLILEKAFLLKFYSKIPRIFRHLATLILVIYGWIFFYFEDMNSIGAFHAKLFNNELYVSSSLFYNVLIQNIFWIALVVILCFPWNELLTYNTKKYKLTLLFSSKSYLTPIISLLLLLVSTCYLVGSTYNPFLYFRF